MLVCWSERGNVNPEVVGSIPAKPQKTENSNVHGFELHRHLSKSTTLLYQVLIAILIHDSNVEKLTSQPEQRRHARQSCGARLEYERVKVGAWIQWQRARIRIQERMTKLVMPYLTKRRSM